MRRSVGIDRALARQPSLEAPPTLLPRVMAAVQAWAARPWYERAWFTWPRALQIASLTATVLLVIAVWAAIPMASGFIDRVYLSVVGLLGGGVASRMQRVDATISGAQVLWRALVQPILIYAAIVVAAMYIACATVAVALGRILFGRAMQS